jgi:hypothetical protein
LDRSRLIRNIVIGIGDLADGIRHEEIATSAQLSQLAAIRAIGATTNRSTITAMMAGSPMS